MVVFLGSPGPGRSVLRLYTPHSHSHSRARRATCDSTPQSPPWSLPRSLPRARYRSATCTRILLTAVPAWLVHLKRPMRSPRRPRSQLARRRRVRTHAPHARSISAPLPLRSSARDERDDLGVAIFAGRRVGSAFSAARRPSSRAISRGRPERPSARRGRAPPKPRGATPRRARARRAHRRRPTARRHSRCRRRCVRLRACCAQLTARRAPPQRTRRGGARYAC